MGAESLVLNVDTAIELHRSGRMHDADRMYRAILAREPNNAVALHFLGLLQHQNGNSEVAIPLMRQAIEIRPDYTAALVNLGMVLTASDRFDDAIPVLQRAAELTPDMPETHLNLGNALYRLDRFEPALVCFERALALKPDHVNALTNRGSVLRALGRFADAESALRQAVALAPNDVIAAVGLGNVVRDLDRPAEAEKIYRDVLAKVGTDAEATCNLGIALRDQGKVAEALDAFETLTRFVPDFANAHLNLALTQLLDGRFTEGWAEYEWRFRLRPMRPGGLVGLAWDGKPLTGTLLIHAEQGLGDTVQFARFIAEARRHVGRVVFMCHTALKAAAARIPGVDEVFGFNDTLPHYDRIASLLSLPHLLGTGADMFSARPYLTASPERVALWRERLKEAEGLKVGLVWAGSPTHTLDRRRSLTATLMNLLPRVPGLTYVSMQKGRGGEESGKLRQPVIDLGPEINDIDDTLAILSLLDVVVTADTAMAHLAGAMGRPTLLLLPKAADWRWQLNRNDSPWYPQHALFRQSEPGEWVDPLLRVSVELMKLAGQGNSSLAVPELLQEAIAHHGAKRYGDAERSVWHALAQVPRAAQLLLTFGALRVSAGDNASAIALLSRGMLIGGVDAEALANLGVALRGEERFEEAERAYRRAIEIAPGLGSAYYNLANLISARGAWTEAESLYRRALAGAPNNVDTIYNLANAVRDLGRLDEAIALYRRILELRPEYHAVRDSLGMALLLKGEFALGWEAYEARWLGDMLSRGFTQPRWDGQKHAKKTLLVHAEQGMGDTIQFLRYVPRAIERFGGKVVLEVQAPLVDLVHRLIPTVMIVAQNDPLPDFDVYTPLLSLPHMFGTTVESASSTSPYVTALPDRVRKWRKELGKGSALRIGLVWAGNPKHKNDRNRSMPFAALKALPTGKGIRYYALQMGDRRDDIDQAILPVEDLGGRIADFDDSAAVLSCLDLVIACDTATIHLAGALAVPVWTLLPLAPDWRWILARDDTPWYPTMRLFRQWRFGDWSGPLGAITEILAPFADGEIVPNLVARAKAEHDQNHPAEARALAETILALVPGRKEASKLATWRDATQSEVATELAVAAAELRQNRPFCAERRVRRILRGHSNAAEAKTMLMAIHEKRGEAEDPMSVPSAADTAESDSIAAREQRAEALIADGQPAEAKDLLRPILSTTTNVAILNRFAELCASAQAEGVPALERLVTLQPNDARSWHRYGTALYFADRVDDAAAAMRRALELVPTMIEAQSDLGAILTRKGDLETAIAALKRAIEMDSRYAACHGNLGVALRKSGRPEEAVEALDKALALHPTHQDYHWNRALALLHAGRYEEGWRENEWRWKVPGFPSPVRGFKEPLWGGEPIEGKTILVYAEQGLGDTLQFLRYVPMVAARGARVVLEVPSTLIGLARSIPDVTQLVSAGEVLPKFDVQVPLLSLPLAFGTRLETIPAAQSYIAVPANHASPVPELSAMAGLKIGLIWGGNPKHGNDKSRSLKLADFAPMLNLPGVSFVSLQKGPPADQVPQAPGPLLDAGSRLKDYTDTASAMMGLDLVITVDTSTAHCAGALGRPVWVILPVDSDWRWLCEREDTPWYPTMRLFRRKAAEGWGPVIERVVEALQNFGARTTVMAPDQPAIAEMLSQAGQLIAAAKYDDAEAVLRQLLAQVPEHAEAFHHLGVVALKRGRPAEARVLIEQALKIDDRLDTAWANLGVAQRESGDNAAALDSYRRAVALNPNGFGAIYNLGNMHAARGEDAEAIDCFRRVLTLLPKHANALNNLGLALQRRGELDEAIVVLSQAADADSRGTDAAANLSLAYYAQKDVGRALAASNRAVADRPNSALAHRVHALGLKADGQLDAAVLHLSRALQIEPKSAEAYNLLGNAMKGLGRLREALVAFDRALAIEPNRADARFNRATVLLVAGDFKEGWAEYEWRWAAQGFARRSFPQPEWDGKPLAGRTILVHAEQGFGDTIHFARYLTNLAEVGGRVVAEVQADLVDLVRTIDGVAEVVAVGQPLPAFAVHAPMLSLPRLLGTTMGTIPAETPYMRAPVGSGVGLPDLAHAPGLKVGLVWAGNPGHSGDRWRSMSLETLKPLLEIPGVTFVSLQKGEAAGQLADAEAAIVDAGPSLTSFTATAALMEQLDLVIAVDTAAAHCAGALGRPVWVMLPTSPDWRWLLNTPRSPWYPTMRLYRQETLDGWPAVIVNVAKDLAQEVASKRDRAVSSTTARIDIAAEPEIVQNRMPVIFKWGMSSYFGWGVYGVNLLMSWAEDKDIVPVCAVPFNVDNIVVDAMRRRRIQPEIKASRRLIDGLAGHRGEKINSSSLVLHGLGNRLTAVASAHDVDLGGKHNIGVLFIEDTTVDDQVKERAKRYELLIAGSTWNKEVLDGGNCGTPIKVVLQGVDRTLFHPAPRTGLFKDRFVVFSGGKLEYRKGQDVALLAFRIFAERHPEALMVTAWHSPWPDLARALTGNNRIAPVPFSGGKADLAGWAAANGIPADNFVDLGQVPNSQMPTILRECDAGLFTNRGEGGTNLVAMECMASGVPCILSANTGHFDLIKDNTCVPLTRQSKVPPHGTFLTDGWGESDVEEAVEALETLWRDRQQAAVIGQAGAALLAGMSWSDQMMKLKEVVLPYVR
ncbi:MAG TPA: tetratricopeptide repeat protein [Magnetospirillaceae bacterium]|jgi:tetratricopeptide (TPR) repeat protein/glycosyltransferase involved in cell wall biosynthesis